jgi:hypothetical protein
MGLFSNIGQKVSGGLNSIGSKVGSAVSKVGTKVSKYAGMGANITGKLAMGATLLAPELAPALGVVATTLRGVQGVADLATAGGRALQAGDFGSAVRAGVGAVAQGRQTAQNYQTMLGRN